VGWVYGRGYSAQNIPGGYFATALTEDVKTAAEVAVQEQSKRQPQALKLNNIFKAEKQTLRVSITGWILW
jgi:hypothetical protein